MAEDSARASTAEVRVAGLVSGALLAVALAGAATLLVPGLRAYAPSCLFHETTGLLCPGCGAGRALQALLRADVIGALRMNPLAVLLGPPALFALASEALASIGPNAPIRLPRLAVGAGTARALAALVIAFWILRNVSAPPFTWFAPGVGS